VDAGDGIRVEAAAVVVRERVQEGGRKRAVSAAERRGTSEAAATNGKGKRKPEGPEEGGRPSAGGPDRCGARRGQSAAA